jgi:CBS domain-containing protein
MGDQKVKRITAKKARADFIRHLLLDLDALEMMLEKKMIESDITRIGSEQEFCLVESNWRPSKKSGPILEKLDDDHFTTEIAVFNLEINLDPVVLEGDAFSEVEEQLTRLLKKARAKANDHNNKIILTGILPTISKKELEFNYMTPLPRYWMLNDMLKELRGSNFRLHLRGVDELFIKHDSVMFEGCNTSFQLHLQIAPDDFISSYNWAQAISGPILGVCTNSPLLLGRELWSETRIGLFQQSIDTRNSSFALENRQSRVSFSQEWAKGSVADLFKNDISKHKVLISKDIEKNSVEEINKGNMPRLEALCLFNGTIYRWNRPCFGMCKGKPHLRIENRYLPSGPTIIDEMANFAFWVGLMMGRPKKYDDMPSVMHFRDAKSNFVKAARNGKESVMEWMGTKMSVRDLVLNELLPIAREGLIKLKINEKDINRLLGVIEERAKSQTGSQWKVKSYRNLLKSLKQDDALIALTKTIYNNQQTGKPVHEWPVIESPPDDYQDAHLVGHIMTTQLFTVNKNDLADLATSIMEWKGIHHVPVENNNGKLCGLLTKSHMEQFKIKDEKYKNTVVEDIMTKDVIYVRPNTKILEAMHIMKKNKIGCLPVVQYKSLVGIITMKDIIN